MADEFIIPDGVESMLGIIAFVLDHDEYTDEQLAHVTDEKFRELAKDVVGNRSLEQDLDMATTVLLVRKVCEWAAWELSKQIIS